MTREHSVTSESNRYDQVLSELGTGMRSGTVTLSPSLALVLCSLLSAERNTKSLNTLRQTLKQASADTLSKTNKATLKKNTYKLHTGMYLML